MGPKDQCANLAIALAGNETGGVELLKELLSGDMPKLQLKGYGGNCLKSKTKALELLKVGDDTIAELKRLIF
ncbi:MAG: hypothetical protein LBQ23_04345 [Puniceicoccales bacterium]|nr:hypothetical protein [Puniceicoccales bacterium]